MGSSGHTLADVIDVERLQRICDGLSDASGLVLAVLDPEGTILIASGWQDICTRFHRLDPKSSASCLESDLRINERVLAGLDAPKHIAYKCANGLWDVAFPLIAQGEHLANVFTGQFFYDDDDVDVDWFRAQAAERGFDQDAYLEALSRVPIVTHEHVERTISFLADFVAILGETGLAALRREQDHAALVVSEKLYETFINATDDIAFLKDDALRYIIVNTAGAAYFGRAVEEIVGRTDAELMLADAAEECRSSDLEALRNGGLVITTETQGDRVYESRKFPVALTDGRTGAGGYVRDVTEQWLAEAEIMRLASDLERRVAQRTAQLEATNRELESFAYSISHDLRSPLRALDGFSEILLQDYGETLDDAGRDHLRRIKGAANHMAGLMDGLLQLSRLNREELDFQEVDLTGLAEGFVAELHERDPARDVVVDVAPGLVARADPKLVRLVLENLLGNAWKFTSRHEKAHVEFGADQTDGGTTFFVRDDGAGFDMRYAKNLFGAFQRLHTPDQFEGTGIGLATVQRIVHRHGGTVWAEGEVEKGATFWFTLEPPDAA